MILTKILRGKLTRKQKRQLLAKTLFTVLLFLSLSAAMSTNPVSDLEDQNPGFIFIFPNASVGPTIENLIETDPMKLGEYANVTVDVNHTANGVDTVLIEIGGTNYTMIWQSGNEYKYTWLPSAIGTIPYTIYANASTIGDINSLADSLEVQGDYYLTVTSTYGTPTGGGWFSSGAYGNASLNTDTVAGTPGIQYVFTNWAGDGTGTNYALSDNVLMDSNKTITAVWQTQYYLTVESDHGTPSGEGWFDSGTNGVASVDVDTVSGGAGIQYVFTNWGGDATGTTYSGSNNILMDAPKTATAVWKTQYYLTVTSTYGTPSGEGWYDAGTNGVAAVDAGTVAGATGVQYVFTSWTGDATGTTYSGSNNILMDAPKTATASWTTQYYLTVDSAHGTPSGEGWYDAGTNGVAAVDAGTVAGGSGVQYVFTSWTGDATGTTYSGSNNILMDAPKTATASWTTQYYLTVDSAHGMPSGEGWYDAGTNGVAAVDAGTVAGATGVQYVFTSWSGDATGTTYSGSNNILMDAPKTATATWTTQYYLTVESDHGTPSGGGWFDSGTNGVAAVDAGTVAGGTGIQYVFTNWGADATGTNYAGSNNILMDAPKTATATWKTQYYLTVTSAYGTPSGGGWLDAGTNGVAAVDVGTVAGGSGIQYVFTSWSGDATGTTYSGSNNILMDAPKTATATWTTQYYLTVTSAYGIPSGEGWFDSGTNGVASVDTDTVSGGAGIQYAFASWSGDATGTNYAGSANILMDAPKTATAMWTTQYYLTVTSTYGTPSGEGWYDAGTNGVASVDVDTVSGGAGTQYVFTSWSGDATGTNYAGSSNILMDAPKTATATWTTQYYLTVTLAYGTPSGEGWYDAGTNGVASVDADTVSGGAGIQYVFVSWSGDATGTNYAGSNNILMDAAKTATATWTTQYYLTVASTHGTLSGEGWHDSGTDGVASVDTDTVSGGAGIQYVFASWSGDATGTNYAGSNNILMDAPKTATATWTTQYYLTVTSTYGTPSGEGWYDAGTDGVASVDVDTVSGGAGIQYVFTSWSGDATGTTYSGSNNILMDAPKTASATWTTQYYLTVTSAHGTPSGEGWYDSGTGAIASLDVETVSSGIGTQYAFSHWEDDATGSTYSGSNSINMDAPKTAAANWSLQYYLEVVSLYNTPSGTGWYDENSLISVSIDSDIYLENSTHRYIFINWTGDANGTDYSGSDNIFIDAPKTATANWTRQFLLNISISPVSLTDLPIVTPSGSWFFNNTELHITAQDILEYNFEYWEVDGATDSNETTLILIMNNTYDVVAVYSEDFVLGIIDFDISDYPTASLNDDTDFNVTLPIVNSSALDWAKVYFKIDPTAPQSAAPGDDWTPITLVNGMATISSEYYDAGETLSYYFEINNTKGDIFYVTSSGISLSNSTSKTNAFSRQITAVPPPFNFQKWLPYILGFVGIMAALLIFVGVKKAKSKRVLPEMQEASAAANELVEQQKRLLKEANKAEKDRDYYTAVTLYEKAIENATALFKFGQPGAAAGIKSYKAKIAKYQKKAENAKPSDKQAVRQKAAEFLKMAEDAEKNGDFGNALVVYHQILLLREEIRDKSQISATKAKIKHIITEIPDIKEISAKIFQEAEEKYQANDYVTAYANYRYLKTIFEALGDKRLISTVDKLISDVSKLL